MNLDVHINIVGISRNLSTSPAQSHSKKKARPQMVGRSWTLRRLAATNAPWSPDAAAPWPRAGRNAWRFRRCRFRRRLWRHRWSPNLQPSEDRRRTWHVGYEQMGAAPMSLLCLDTRKGITVRIEMGGLVLTEKRDFAIKMDGTTKNKKAKKNHQQRGEYSILNSKKWRNLPAVLWF